MGRRTRGGRLSVSSVLLMALILVVSYLQSRDPGSQEQVSDVLDGDSLVIYRNGDRREVRLYAVDAPEKGQAYGAEARAFTRELARGKAITMKVVDEDQYDRLVAEVFLEDGRSVNEALVEAGLAWWYQRHAEGNRTLSRLEREAREAGRGLWADPDPEPPWEFRRRMRES